MKIIDAYAESRCLSCVQIDAGSGIPYARKVNASFVDRILYTRAYWIQTMTINSTCVL